MIEKVAARGDINYRTGVVGSWVLPLPLMLVLLLLLLSLSALLLV